ncbi:MAG TPA: AraC family transcriptional regulator [Rhizomicrobium sp.]|jgi:transcriptional regulator GlxA family with amidase domain
MVTVGLLLPEGFANFSFAPLAVFEAANVILAEPLYQVRVLSIAGGSLHNSFGMTVETERADDVAVDTLLVGGAPDNSHPAPEMVAFLRHAPARIRRIAAICGAAFTLGEAGLLDGRRATTHWRLGKKLQDRFPSASLEVDRIFIADGPIWTSAGMTAGIDLALSLVEHGLAGKKPAWWRA